MKQRIKPNFTEEELDFFLKENYGYGIWHFKHSLFEIFIPYYPKKTKYVYQLIRLIIDRQINSYKEAATFKSYEKFISRGGSLPLYLKPLNLVVLTWSYVMKTGKKVDWINMENLINWFSRNIGQTKVLDFYAIRKCDSPPSEILRFTRNKYKNTLNDSWAKNIFISSFDPPFEASLDECIEKFPNPLEGLESFMNSMLMSVNELVIFEDVSMFKKWIKGFNR